MSDKGNFHKVHFYTMSPKNSVHAGVRNFLFAFERRFSG